MDCDKTADELHIGVDRSKIASYEKFSIDRMTHRIHIWRCTADVASCKTFYEPLSTVDGDYEIWKKIVASKPEPPWKFVQTNTVLRNDGQVELKVYEKSNENIIQSFVNRDVWNLGT